MTCGDGGLDCCVYLGTNVLLDALLIVRRLDNVLLFDEKKEESNGHLQEG